MTSTLLHIHDLLLARYGQLNWWPAETPFEVCIGAILTQNTNWRNVEQAIANLRREGLLSPGALATLPLDQLAEAIRPSGFFNVKSRRVKDFVAWLYECFDGSMERLAASDWQQLRQRLLLVRGIGEETCDSILLYACHQPTFVVDAYTRRLFSRLGLVSERSDYESVRLLFMDNLPADTRLFNEYHALIVEQCKRYCRKTPGCTGCPLEQLCQFAGHHGDPVAPPLLGTV